MTKLNFRWFGWARVLFSSAKPTCAHRPRAAAPTVRPPANAPAPTHAVRVSAHGIDFIPLPEGSR